MYIYVKRHELSSSICTKGLFDIIIVLCFKIISVTLSQLALYQFYETKNPNYGIKSLDETKVYCIGVCIVVGYQAEHLYSCLSYRQVIFCNKKYQ